MSEVWLTVDEVCSLSGEIRETVRRKCKRKEYVSKFIKSFAFSFPRNEHTYIAFAIM